MQRLQREAPPSLRVVLRAARHGVRRARDHARSSVGRTLPVLFERAGRYGGQLVGRSPYLQSVHVAAGVERIGEVVPTVISGARANSLSGSIAEAA